MEKTTSTFSSKQREELADLIKSAKIRALDDDSLRVWNNDQVMREIAKEAGLDKKIERLQSLRDELNTAEQELRDSGFSLDDGEKLVFTGRAPDSYRTSYSAKVKSRRHAAESKYENAILTIWTVETLEAARKLVEGVI